MVRTFGVGGRFNELIVFDVGFSCEKSCKQKGLLHCYIIFVVIIY